MKLDKSVVIPFGVTRKYLERYDEIFIGQEEIISDFDLDIIYPEKENTEIIWGEMSYRQFTETSLTWNYDFYSQGSW